MIPAFLSFSTHLAVSIALVGLIVPLAQGILFHLIFLFPFQAAMTRENEVVPVITLHLPELWCYGVVTLNLACAIHLLRPLAPQIRREQKLDQLIRQLRQHGIRNDTLRFLCRDIALPHFRTQLLLLSLPVAVGKVMISHPPALLGWLSLGAEPSMLYARLFPIIFLVAVQNKLMPHVQASLARWIKSVKDEEYLLERRLQNITEVEHDVAREHAEEQVRTQALAELVPLPDSEDGEMDDDEFSEFDDD